MRKLFAFNMVTLDGFFEGPNRDIGWHNVDDEFNQFAIEQTSTLGAILFGRVTYEGMASYWPTPDAQSDDPVVANLMNTLPKVVFSRTLQKAEWNNTRLIKDNVAEEILKMKQEPGNALIQKHHPKGQSETEFLGFTGETDAVSETASVCAQICESTPKDSPLDILEHMFYPI